MVKLGDTVKIGPAYRMGGRYVADEATGIVGEVVQLCADGSEALVDDRVWVPVHRLEPGYGERGR